MTLGPLSPEDVARFVGARPTEVSWAMNATDALNTVAQALMAGCRTVFETRFSTSGFWPAMQAAEATVVYLLGAVERLNASVDAVEPNLRGGVGAQVGAFGVRELGGRVARRREEGGRGIEVGKLVLGENVSQALQFATAGGAQGGIVAYSLVLDPAFAARANYALLPASWHQPLRQRMVLMKGAGSVARRFYTYVQQPSARRIFVRYGFALPGEAR